MGKYRLINKSAKEVVDVQELTDMEEAKEFFYLKKQFSSKEDFDKLYEVKSENKEKKETPQFW